MTPHQFTLLDCGYCPFCSGETVEDRVHLEGQQELESDHERSWYVTYYKCPVCDQWEELLAARLGLRCVSCNACNGHGTTGYDEWEEYCGKCGGTGYLLSEGELTKSQKVAVEEFLNSPTFEGTVFGDMVDTTMELVVSVTAEWGDADEDNTIRVCGEVE